MQKGPVQFFLGNMPSRRSYGRSLEQFRHMVCDVHDQLGISLQQLADTSGIGYQTIRRFIEEPSHNPRRDTLRKLALAFDRARAPIVRMAHEPSVATIASSRPSMQRRSFVSIADKRKLDRRKGRTHERRIFKRV